MFIAAVIAVFILTLVVVGLIRVAIAKDSINMFDTVNLLAGSTITFLLVYYNII